MATPATYLMEDPTRGLELVDGQAEGTEATRYVFLGLDVLDPERRDQVEKLRRGGEEVQSHCLRRTPNFVPRCYITPVEIWVEHMPPHAVPEGVRSVEVKDPTLITPVTDTRSAINNLLRGKPLRSIRTFPGDEMSDITGTYQKVGITELTALKGIEWDAGDVQELQQAFFPDDWSLPIELRKIEERIREVYSVHPRVADDMLRGTAQSRRWAQARLQAEHVLLDTRKEHQWTYTYSPIARSLLAQLEMTPRDQGWETLMAQSNIHLAQAIAGAQTQAAGMDINALATAIATAIVAAQAQNKTAEQVKDEAASVKEYLCSGCGAPFPTPQGKSMHERKHCTVLQPKEDSADTE